MFSTDSLANSLDPDQARLNVGPDLGPDCLTLMVFLKEFFEKVDFEKKISQQQSMQHYLEGIELKTQDTEMIKENRST